MYMYKMYKIWYHSNLKYGNAMLFPRSAFYLSFRLDLPAAAERRQGNASYLQRSPESNIPQKFPDFQEQ